jgi:putative tricarboxylic transport membrane protein
VGGSPRPNIAGIHRLGGLHQRRARNRASAQGAKRLRRRRSGRAICPATALRKDFRLAPARPSMGANFAGARTTVQGDTSMKAIRHRGICAVAALGMAQVLAPTSALAAWEPTRPVEFIVPAGTGGGADQMARTIQGIVTKHNLMKQPMVVINKSGGAGGEGFLDVKSSRNNPHKLIITLSNLFTTPLATGIPFNWKDMTPVAMMALDEFILWVNAESPYKSVKEYIEAAKKEPGKFKMGGTGSKQEDQIITVAIERATGTKFTYIPFRGGGEVAVQLVGKHVDSTVNNPIEAVAQWRGNAVRPLCVFDSKTLPYTDKVANNMSWSEVPTCKSQGLDVEYLMLRGIFTVPNATKDQIDYYVDLLKKVRETPEWKTLMSEGAFNNTFMTGEEYAKWIDTEEKRHQALMKEAGFLAGQ